MSQTPESMHMLTHLFSPRGIPASYRHMEGFGVNTYKMVNAKGDTVLVKYHFHPRCGVASLTADEAAKVQGQDLGSASKDLFEAIERGEYPQWDMYVQIMEDHDHPELDWDPLDDTKIWPEKDFPLRHLGVMTLNRNVEDHFNENEQIAMGTGVLVDGLDFSDDKMLVGRTFSYSDTQRYRVGTNYLQLPVNQAKNARVSTNLNGGQMSYRRDLAPGQNPHVNFEPSIHNGLHETPREEPNNPPEIRGRLTRSVIERRNDYLHPRGRYSTMMEWERDDLVNNMGTLLGQCERDVQERMVWHFLMVHDDYGTRVGKIARHQARRCPQPAAAAEAGADRRGSAPAEKPRQERRQARPGRLGPMDELREELQGLGRGGSWRHARRCRERRHGTGRRIGVARLHRR